MTPQNSSHFAIREWSIGNRPCEKMLQNGAHQLTNAELLAILIGSGRPGASAVDLMQRLLVSVENSAAKLHALPLEHLMEWKGIGPAKAVKIKAALESGKRIHLEAPLEQIQCSSSKQSFKVFHPVLSFLDHEEFWVAYLNNQNKVISRDCISKGGIAATRVDLRLVLKRALEVGATALVMAHNHPTGNLHPSASDVGLTKKMNEAAKILDIGLLDHLIVSEKNYFSFADENKL